MQQPLSPQQHLSGLTDHSRQTIDQFYRWSQLSLDKFKRDLAVEASAFSTGNLLQNPGVAYSRDQVSALLHGQLAMLQSLVSVQVESTTDAAAELTRAVLRDADRQRVAVTVDANAVLNNAGGVSAMGAHGRQLLSGPTGRLAPISLEAAGGEAARQLSEANEEVRRLQRKLQQVTDAYAQVMSGRSTDTTQLLEMQDAMNDKARLADELARRCLGSQDGGLHAAVQQLRSEVAESKRELSGRLNQSTQYQQVKQLLAQRNEQLKTMRVRLAAYDPSFLGADGDDIAAEDD